MRPGIFDPVNTKGTFHYKSNCAAVPPCREASRLDARGVLHVMVRAFEWRPLFSESCRYLFQIVNMLASVKRYRTPFEG
jgi:hypothetical protein